MSRESHHVNAVHFSHPTSESYHKMATRNQRKIIYFFFFACFDAAESTHSRSSITWQSQIIFYGTLLLPHIFAYFMAGSIFSSEIKSLFCSAIWNYFFSDSNRGALEQRAFHCSRIIFRLFFEFSYFHSLFEFLMFFFTISPRTGPEQLQFAQIIGAAA